MACMTRHQNDSDTLNICFCYEEGKYDITLKDPTGGPQANMYLMNTAKRNADQYKAQTLGMN